MATLFIQVNDQLSLREIQLSDAAEVFQTIHQQRDYLGEWLPFVSQTKSLDDSIQFIQSILNTPLPHREAVYCLFWENNFCGLIGFRNTDSKNKKTEIGYWISESFQKRGIATAATKALIEMAFHQNALNRITIRCATENIKSRKIPEKLGFSLEGIEKQGELMSDGRFVDLYVYRLFATDYKQ